MWLSEVMPVPCLQSDLRLGSVVMTVRAGERGRWAAAWLTEVMLVPCSQSDQRLGSVDGGGDVSVLRRESVDDACREDRPLESVHLRAQEDER